MAEALAQPSAGAPVGASTDALPPPSGRRGFLGRYGWSYVFVAPILLVFVVFTLIPVVWTFVASFKQTNPAGIVGSGPFVGLRNYHDAFTTDSGVFRRAILNTLLYTIVTVVVNVLVSLVLASLLQPLHRRAKKFFRAVYYIPAVTSVVIIAMTWRWIFNAQSGLMNYLFSLVGLKPVLWLADPHLAMGSIILSTMLTIPAAGVVLMTAAIEAVPTDFGEAAALDGAGPVRRWWSITVPLVKPTLLYVVVIYTIASFEVFEKVFLMTPAGVGDSTQTIVTLVYEKAFPEAQTGIAAAEAVILFLMIAAVAAIQFRVLRSDVEY